MSVEIDRLEVAIEGSANQANKALTSLQEKLRETIKVLNNANTQSTNSFKALDTVSKNLAKDITSDFNRMSNAVKKDIQSLTSEMVKDFNFNGKLNFDYFDKIIAKTRESALVAKDVESSYLAAYNAIKSTTFSIGNFSDFIDKSEWKNLQKTLPKNFITSKTSKGGDDIDSQYKALQEQFGKGLFPEANTAAEQLRALANIVKTVRDNTTDVTKSTRDWAAAEENLIKQLSNAADTAQILVENSKKPLSEQIAEYSKKIGEAQGKLELLRREQNQGSSNQGGINVQEAAIQKYTAALEAAKAEQERIQKSKPNGTIAEFAKQLQSSSATFEKVSTQLTEVSSKLASLNGAELSNFAKGLREVSDSAIASQNAFKGNTLGAFVSNMRKLDGLDGAKIGLLGEGLNKLGVGLSALNGTEIANIDGISRAISLLRQISNIDLSTFDTAKLEGVGKALSLFTAELESARNIDRSVIAITNALAKLAQNANNIPIVSQSLGALGVELTKFVNSMSAVQVVPTEITTFTQAIAQLANAGNKTLVTATNLNALSQSLLQFFTDMQTAPQVSENTIRLTEALSRLASVGNVGSALNQISGNTANARGNLQSLDSVLKSVSNGFKTMASYVGQASLKMVTFSGNIFGYISGINRIIYANNRASSSYKKLASMFGMFYAKYFLVMRGLKLLWKSVESSVDYVETFNFFNVALNKMGKEASVTAGEKGAEAANAYVDGYKSVLEERTKEMTGYTIGASGELIETGNIGLGLDPNQLMNFQAQILSVTNSAGMLQDTSVNTAKALSMLSSDLSSLTNTDLSTVMQNLQSGLIGQSRAELLVA